MRRARQVPSERPDVRAPAGGTAHSVSRPATEGRSSTRAMRSARTSAPAAEPTGVEVVLHLDLGIAERTLGRAAVGQHLLAQDPSVDGADLDDDGKCRG